MRKSPQRFQEFSGKKYTQAGDSDDFASNENMVEKNCYNAALRHLGYIFSKLLKVKVVYSTTFKLKTIRISRGLFDILNLLCPISLNIPFREIDHKFQKRT